MKKSTDPVSSARRFCFAHLSDPHLTSLHQVRRRDLLNKRVLGYLSWRRHRRQEHRSEVLAALVRDLHETGPDHVVVTGDLTHLGLPEEFREASQWLPRLGTPEQVTIVPGNHDAYVHTPWEQTFSHWLSYMQGDNPTITESGSASVFPSLRIRGPLALIGLCSALPSAPFFATGRLGGQQLQRLERLLVETQAQGLLRVLLIHHPPLIHTVGWRKRLTDGEALRRILNQHGVEMILHGHSHRTALAGLATRQGQAPVIGVPSASGIGLRPGRRAQYHLYRFEQHTTAWYLNIAVRGYDPAQDHFIAEGEQRMVLPWSASEQKKTQRIA